MSGTINTLEDPVKLDVGGREVTFHRNSAFPSMIVSRDGEDPSVVPTYGKLAFSNQELRKIARDVYGESERK